MNLPKVPDNPLPTLKFYFIFKAGSAYQIQLDGCLKKKFALFRSLSTAQWLDFQKISKN